MARARHRHADDRSELRFGDNDVDGDEVGIRSRVEALDPGADWAFGLAGDARARRSVPIEATGHRSSSDAAQIRRQWAQEQGAPLRRTTPKEIEAVLRLDGLMRYKHFVKRVVDDEQAWGLWKNGWALMADGAGRSVFPLWPAREYAELCAVGEWDGYVAEEIALADLIDELLPKLVEREVRPGVFPTPTGKGVTPSAPELVEALRTEMENYE
jgi:hypothetical protein